MTRAEAARPVLDGAYSVVKASRICARK